MVRYRRVLARTPIAPAPTLGLRPDLVGHHSDQRDDDRYDPFGLEVLDLAVGKYVYDTVRQDGDLHVVADFFHDLRRHG